MVRLGKGYTCFFFLWFLATYTGMLRAQCAKFEPVGEKVLLIMGQDLGAHGGFAAPDNDGYVENVPTDIPAGITTYTSLPNLSGLKTRANWGAGNICGQCIVNTSTFDQSFLTIGLYMVNRLGQVADGDFDTQIEELARWVKATERPVFLRIGYEFELQYTGESPSKFVSAWKRIVDIFRELEVENCAYVWQAAAGTASWSTLSQYYPGDNYVDWFGYSHFDFNGSTIITEARKRKFPVMIAEATPRGWKLDEAGAGFIWNNWFRPLFDHVEKNKDVIKAFAYINQDWDTQWLWNGQGWGNSRIQDNSGIEERWLDEMAKDKYVFASPSLFGTLQHCWPVGIESTTPSSDLTLMPNPVTEVVTLNASDLPQDDFQLEIQTLSGQLFFRSQFTGGGSRVLDLTDLPSGAYVLRITSGETSLSQKLIKL